MMKAVSTFTLISLLFFSFACRQETTVADTAATTETTDTASATHPASPGGSALVPDVAAGTTVVMVVREGSVAFEGQSVPPGPTVITAQNAGTQKHNLFIEGEGIARAVGEVMDPGGTQTTDVVLKPGTYTFYCPLLNHRENGEQTTIVVGAGSTGTDTAPVTDTSATSGT